MEYGERAQEIHDTLCNLALEITKHVNSFYPYALMRLVAIDRNERICYMSSGPETKNHEWRGLKIQLPMPIILQ